jgi:hypothetical protein
MPFMVHMQLHMQPAIILQRFCKAVALISSSQVQVIFMPPAHFSNFIVQRGTIIIAGAAADIPPCGIEPMADEPMAPIEPIIGRSNIIVLDILNSPKSGRESPVGYRATHYWVCHPFLGCYRLPAYPVAFPLALPVSPAVSLDSGLSIESAAYDALQYSGATKSRKCLSPKTLHHHQIDQVDRLSTNFAKLLQLSQLPARRQHFAFPGRDSCRRAWPDE